METSELVHVACPLLGKKIQSLRKLLGILSSVSFYSILRQKNIGRMVNPYIIVHHYDT